MYHLRKRGKDHAYKLNSKIGKERSLIHKIYSMEPETLTLLQASSPVVVLSNTLLTIQ